jgi:hypothetical protein
MRRPVTMATVAAVCLCAGWAIAANGWQTVTLAGNPNFTVEIPASVGTNYAPDQGARAQGMLMYFTLATKDSGTIGCGLSATAYAAFRPRKEVTGSFWTAADYFCKAVTADSTGAKSLAVHAAVNSASPGAVCATSFAKGDAGSNGYVWSSLSVAAPDQLYHLNCLVNAASQDTAEKAWSTTWAKFVAHVQESIHLPVKGELTK